MTFEEFIDSPELVDFVGENTERYREVWKALYEKAGSIEAMNHAQHWNWAAALLGPIWLFYRKMWLAGFLILALIIGLSVGELMTGMSAVFYFFLVVPLWLGLLGDATYFRHAYLKVSGAKAKGSERKLFRRGGTSSQAAGFGGLALVMGLLGVQIMSWTGDYEGESTLASLLSSVLRDEDGSSADSEETQTDSEDAAWSARARQAAVQPAATARPSPIMGTYQYAEDGYSGTMKIGHQGGAAYSVSIETTESQRFHTCGAGSDNAVASQITLSSGEAAMQLTWHDEECDGAAIFLGDEAAVQAEGASCRAGCGMAGNYLGSYRKAKQQ